MSSQNRQSSSVQLPEELMSMIFSKLTVIELARAQQTCKRWYNIAQNNGTLWIDAAPFFNHIQKSQGPYQKINSLIKLSGLQKLKELSNNKLDGIVLHSDYNDKQCVDDPFRLAIFEALKEHPPTRLTIVTSFLRNLDQRKKRDDPCLELMANIKSLKHLSLYFAPTTSSWQLKLSSSLESLDLICPPFSKCSNGDDLIKTLMNVKKMTLQTTLERPGNLEFLDKIGQNLENLELIERFLIPSSTRRPNGEEKITIRFPKLKELTLDSFSHDLNKFYQLDCPLLQSLSLRENLLSREGQGFRLHELLLSTDTITHVSISLCHHGSRHSSKNILKRFFGKFCHIEEMHTVLWSRVTLQILFETLPKTVSKLNITLNRHDTYDGTIMNKLEEIRDNGGIEKQAKNDDNLLCTFSVPDGPKGEHYEVTILGKTNLHALVSG